METRVLVVFVHAFCMFLSTCCCLSEIMSVLWDQKDAELRRFLKEGTSDKDSTFLVNRLSQLPFTEELKSNAWYSILRRHSLENFELEDWEAFQALIPYIPPEILRVVNLTNYRVLKYFGEQELQPFQLSLLAEAIAMIFGEKIFNDGDLILRMGNIFCGLPDEDLAAINSTILRTLLVNNFFRNLQSCSLNQLKILTRVIQKHTIIGPPRTWRPETVRLIGNLVAGLTSKQMRQIRERSFSLITPEVIEKTPADVLKAVRLNQLRALRREALLAWRRKTQDLRPLYASQDSCTQMTTLFVFCMILIYFVKSNK